MTEDEAHDETLEAIKVAQAAAAGICICSAATTIDPDAVLAWFERAAADVAEDGKNPEIVRTFALARATKEFVLVVQAVAQQLGDGR